MKSIFDVIDEGPVVVADKEAGFVFNVVGGVMQAYERGRESGNPRHVVYIRIGTKPLDSENLDLGSLVELAESWLTELQADDFEEEEDMRRAA